MKPEPSCNVLLIIVDQWRADTLGFFGHPCARTHAHWEYDFGDPSGEEAERLGIDPDSTSLAVVCDNAFAYIHSAELPTLLFDLHRRDPHCGLHNVADDPAYAGPALTYARRILDWWLRHADRARDQQSRLGGKPLGGECLKECGLA